MNHDLRRADLSTVLAEAGVVTDEVTRRFGRLSAAQMNWKPDRDEWSIAQCLDHLVVSERPFVPIFEDIRAGRRRQRSWERIPVLPRLFGSLLITTLRPDSGRNVRARPAFRPSESDLSPGVVATFLEQQQRLRGLMAACRSLDLDGIIVTSPVLGLITYSVMDACRIVVAHEQNHVVQATRVAASPGFPA
jgi:hypothetical protein